MVRPSRSLSCYSCLVLLLPSHLCLRRGPGKSALRSAVTSFHHSRLTFSRFLPPNLPGPGLFCSVLLLHPITGATYKGVFHSLMHCGYSVTQGFHAKPEQEKGTDRRDHRLLFIVCGRHRADSAPGLGPVCLAVFRT